jgi:TusA-related sulfurtransferase
MKEIDARGLACPGPVLQTKAAIDLKKWEALNVIVDNEASKQNVCWFLESNGYQTGVKDDDRNFVITGTLSESPESQPEKQISTPRTEDKKLWSCVQQIE